MRPAAWIFATVDGPLEPSASARLKIGSTTPATVGNDRGKNLLALMSASISAYAWVSEACGTLNLVGSGITLGSENMGPLAGVPTARPCEGVLVGVRGCFFLPDFAGVL